MSGIFYTKNLEKYCQAYIWIHAKFHENKFHWSNNLKNLAQQKNVDLAKSFHKHANELAKQTPDQDMWIPADQNAKRPADQAAWMQHSNQSVAKHSADSEAAIAPDKQGMSGGLGTVPSEMWVKGLIWTTKIQIRMKERKSPMNSRWENLVFPLDDKK